MTLEELTRKYNNRFVDDEKLSETFSHMGKFGRVTVFMFSFDTENATVRTEVCVKGRKLIGFTPEKEPRVDEWSYTAEGYEEDLTEEEYARIDLYLASIMASPAPAAE